MKQLRRIAPFAVVGLVLGVWWIAAARSAIFPTPLGVVLGIGELARAGTLALHVQASLLRVAMGYGVAWLVVVAAEMVAINSGLGYLIIDARNAGSRYDLVVAGMVLIGVIGFALDLGMRRLESLDAVRWRYDHAR